MQDVMKNIANQINSGNIQLNSDSYEELKTDFLALAITVAEIANGAAYLFNKSPPDNPRDWKAELELEQYRQVLEQKKTIEEN